jgi:hypothetical protein
MRTSLLFILVLTFLSLLKADETGYVNKISLTQGDTLKLYISTSVNPFSVQIYKYNDVDSLVTTISNISGGIRAYPDSCYYYGCNWPLSYSLVIPTSWLPGVYYAQFPTSVGSKSVLFMVSPKVRGSYSKILYLASANTWEAYNPIGGKSLYTYNSSNGVASYKVSFQRPGRAYTGYPEFSFELPFVRWLYRNHINVEYAVNYNIHSDPNFLSNYKVMVVDGHNEYWSNPEKTETQNFVTNGGNLIILSGNTCWWQVRYENNGNTIICYKDPSVDPLTGIIDSLVTYNWPLSPLNSPENNMTGLGYLSAGYVNDGDILPASAGYGGYTVYNHHSWVYNGTGLMEGEDLGYSDAIVGDETDGGLFNFVNGIPAFTGTDGSPTNFIVLGLSPASSTWGFNPIPRATFGIFHKQGGGTVFNAATINWSLGLDSNYYVQKITKNVFDKFTANKFPPDIVSWTPFNVETDFIQNENIPLNKRNFLRVDTSTVNLSVNAVNPYSGTISYQWFVNSLPAGSGSTLHVNNSQFSGQNKVNKIKALAYNSFDTSSISWNYFNTQLSIYSDPVTNVNIHSIYLYRINIFNNYNDSLTITAPGAPSWLSVTSDGELKGTAPGSVGSYPIKIIVTNQHAQADTQSFYLSVVDPSIIVTTYQLNITALIGGFYNGTRMQPDTITVELRNNTAPYVLVDSRKVVLDSTGKGIGQFTNSVNNVPYFIVVKHRNSIETWSASPQAFNNKTMVYDFTSSQTQAYGNNLAVKNGKWCIYNGDVNQDGIVDGTDVAAVDNANSAFSTGYLATDLNGDGIIDGSDLAIIDNNNNAFIAKYLPPGANNSVNKKTVKHKEFNKRK